MGQARPPEPRLGDLEAAARSRDVLFGHAQTVKRQLATTPCSSGPS